MKKILLAAIGAATLMSANAQILSGSFQFVPAELTKSNHTVMTSVEDDGEGTVKVTIFDGMNPSKQFDIQLPEYKETRGYLYAEGDPIIKIGHFSTYPVWWAEGIDFSNMTAEQLVAFVNENEYSGYGYSSADFTTFFDEYNNLSLYLRYNSFYNEEFLGQKYPRAYFSVIGGELYVVNADYCIDADIEHYPAMTWIKDEENVDRYSYYPDMDEYGYFNFDNGKNIPEISFSLTQTLFNDDDAWEYALPAYETRYGESDDVYHEGFTENGKVLFRRTYWYGDEIAGINIVSENGNVLSSTNFNNDCLDYCGKIGRAHV